MPTKPRSLPASGRSVRLTRCYLRSVGAQGRPSRREEAFTLHARTNASDDICDFPQAEGSGNGQTEERAMLDPVRELKVRAQILHHAVKASESAALERLRRSEERRVGKEGRSRWSPYH